MALRITLALALLLSIGCAAPELKGVAARKTEFITDPTGAALLLDGNPIGKTPCVMTLPNDRSVFEVTLEKGGYWTLTTSIEQDAAGWGSSYVFALKRR